MKKLSFGEIEKIIKKAKRIMVACHLGPDADAIGSLLALGAYLEKLRKKTYLLCASGVPESLGPLKGSETIKSKHPKTFFDLIIGLDHGDKWRLGLDAYVKKYPKTQILVFDHHPVTDQGNMGIIRPDASSTSELIYDYFNAIGFKINKDIAYNLLAGILTDTGFLKYTRDSRPLKIAIELMKFGITPSQIDSDLNGHVKLEAMRLGGRILNRAKHVKRGNFCYSWLRRKELNKHHLTTDSIRGITERLRNLREGKFSLLLIEEHKKRIRGELRSRPDKNYDVSKLAVKLGGGGHEFSAGFRAKGTIDSTIKLVAKYASK